MTQPASGEAVRPAIVGVGGVLVLLGLIVGTAGWVFLGRVVPYLEGGAPEYWVLLRSFGALGGCVAGSLVMLFVAHVAIVRTFSVRDRHRFFALDSIAYLLPLSLFGIVPLAVGL